MRPVRFLPLLAGAYALAAAGAVAAPLPDRAAATLAGATAHAYPGEAYSQYYYRRGGYGYRRRGNGGAVAAGVLGGLAAGALLGSAIANAQQPAPAYGPGPGFYGPGPGQPVGNVYGRDPNWVSYCASRYRSFDPISGTYMASDGFRYPCR